ncbi:hypothetical protein [Actinoplanes sp. NPDC049802]|uniref:hypothetical protein n=1 Tax=Actinoplanes sp. NPDC049802 TaxID=3154742 RepID=UPI0033D67655
MTFAALHDGPLRVLDSGIAVGEVAAGGVCVNLALMCSMPTVLTAVLDDCCRWPRPGSAR